MLSNSGERWLISMTDMPLPRQSRSSSRMRSRTGRGSAPGPALKLWTRLAARALTVASVTEWVSSFVLRFVMEVAGWRSFLTFQNSRDRRCEKEVGTHPGGLGSVANTRLKKGRFRIYGNGRTYGRVFGCVARKGLRT